MNNLGKRIIVYYSKFNIGGAERSLSRMMNALCREGHTVVLLTKYGGGSCESMLDSGIKHISLAPDNDFICKHGISSVFARCRTLARQAMTCVKLYLKRESFDLLILGSQGASPTLPTAVFDPKLTVKCIRNDLLHCNGREHGIRNIKKYKDIIDYYLCVSLTAKESLCTVVPEVAEKSLVYYNFLDIDDMKNKISTANNPFESDGKVHIVTVCRVSDVSKGVFRMLNVCERLLKSGYPIEWYLVGDGDDYSKLWDEVVKRKMTDSFIMVGKIDNPFGYYANADLVAVLSYYEGLCGVVNEAKVSGAAVIATEFSGIHEQIDHGINGWIVDNSEEAIYDGMAYLLDHRDILSNLKNTIYPSEIIDDKSKLDKLYKLAGWI